MKYLAEIQKELKAPKGQYNDFGNYKYRSAEDILEAVKPLLFKNECILTLSDTLENIKDRYYVKATVTLNTPDTKIQVSAYAREDETKKGMDGSQITGAASSYARKYALNGLFLIDDTKDADTNAYREIQNNAEPPRLLADKIRQLANGKGISERDICRQGGVAKIEDMPVPQAKECIRWLEGLK